MNKIKYGLKGARYATIEEDMTANTIEYDTPVALAGAVSLTMDAVNAEVAFFADDMTYYSSFENQGYTATLELALIPTHFRTSVLGDQIIDGILVENADFKTKKIALLFEFDGDVKATRHALLYCTVSRPNDGSTTKGSSVEPQTQTINITVTPRFTDRHIRFSTVETTPEAKYNSWYEAVPTATQGE